MNPNTQAGTARIQQDADRFPEIPGPATHRSISTATTAGGQQLEHTPHLGRLPTVAILRAASYHESQNDGQVESQRLGSSQQGERQAVVPDAGTEQRNSVLSSRIADATEDWTRREVFKPSFWRLDSRVVLAHTTLQWLTNAAWVLLIWNKLDGGISCSWWVVFSPTIVNHVLHIPMQIIVMMMAGYFVRRQIGPPPPPSASFGLTLAYATMRDTRVRSHRVDWANNALESGTMFIVKLLFCDALHRGTLESTSLRLMFTPIWVCWAATMLLQCSKLGLDNLVGWARRTFYFLFLLLVALKVDGCGVSSWEMVFMGPFWWFVGMITLACALGVLLMTRVCKRDLPDTRQPQVLLEAGAFMALLSCALPHIMAFRALQRMLERTAPVSVESIAWPMSLSWLLMWVSSLIIVAGLRLKELRNAELEAMGAVWTAHEGAARQLRLGWGEAQHQVDKLSTEEVSRLVQSMMAGKTKPGRLRRVGENLYKRIASLEPASQGTAPATASVAANTPTHGSGSGVVVQATSIPCFPTSLDALGAQRSGALRVAPAAAAGLPSVSPHNGMAAGGVAPGEVRAVELQRLDEDRDLERDESSFRCIAQIAIADHHHSHLLHQPHSPQPLHCSQPRPYCPKAGTTAGASGDGSPVVGPILVVAVDSRDDSSGAPTEPTLAAATGESTPPRRAPAVLPVDEVEAVEGDAAGVPALPAAAAVAAGGLGGSSSSTPPCMGGSSSRSGADGSRGVLAGVSADSEADNACVICYDNEASCVFLECGHGGFCRRCAYLLFVRPPNECPTCRAVIDQVVEIDGAAPVGEVATIK